MAAGDAALLAGMDLVHSTDDRRNGYAEDNKTRDYIAADRTRLTAIERRITFGWGDPSGGIHGDIYFKLV